MLLMTPGPIAVDPRVIASINRPAIPPEHPSFMAVLDDVFQKLRTIYRTNSWVTLFPGSGRVGLEAATVSVLQPGEACVHLINGSFGELAVDIACRAGAMGSERVEGRWGGPIDLQRVEDALRRVHPKLVTVVHSETSTGALYSLAEIARLAHAHGALVIVDAISSVVNMPFDMKASECDLVVAASNKGIGSLHGLAMVAVSPRAIDAMNARAVPCSSWSLDLKRWNDMYFGASPVRRSATPPPTHLVYALQEACRLLLEEGVEAHWHRIHRCAEATRHAVRTFDLELFPDADLTGDCVTAIRVPEGMTGPEIVRRMEAHGVLIGGTVMRPSPISGKLVRISHQGIQASPEMLIPTLAILERTLVGGGFQGKRGTMVSSFQAVWEALA